MNTTSPECYTWAARLGVAILRSWPPDDWRRFLYDDHRPIEHPDGALGLITIDAVCDAALMSIAGEKDRHIRQFLLDNTRYTIGKSGQ